MTHRGPSKTWHGLTVSFKGHPSVPWVPCSLTSSGVLILVFNISSLGEKKRKRTLHLLSLFDPISFVIFRSKVLEPSGLVSVSSHHLLDAPHSGTYPLLPTEIVPAKVTSLLRAESSVHVSLFGILISQVHFILADQHHFLEMPLLR